MSPEDHARELVAHSPDGLIGAAQREEIPVGFTWASLIPGDTEDLDQDAVERANGHVMEALLDAIEDAEYAHIDGYIVVRVLDKEGRVTPEGIAAAKAMYALADYPLLDEEAHSEIAWLGVEHDWEEIESELEGGYLWVWERSEQVPVVDELPKGALDDLVTRYSAKETETPMDDRGYYGVNRSLVAKILEEMGLVEEED